MYKNSRTIWTEGMLLGPQHFQQHDRYLQNTIAAINQGCSPFPYGLLGLEIDNNALAESKFALREISGIFSDGTPFNLPEEDELPAPLEINSDTRDRLVSLALPFATNADKDVTEERSPGSFSQYILRDQSIADRQSPDSDATEIVFTGGLWTRLIFEDDQQSAFHTIPLARIRERRDDGSVLLDDTFFCCALSLQASPSLISLCQELYGLLTQRGVQLAEQLGQPTASDTSLFAQFLLLQITNRARPLLQHYTRTAAAHPEQLFRDLLQLAGELSTITHKSRQCPEFPDYLHREQSQSFSPLLEHLRECLNWIADNRVEAIAVDHVKAGIYSATVRDLNLFNTSRFILAVKARVTPDKLARRFPRQTTIASKAKLRELVESQSQGIELKTLVSVPNSIPMYENFVYFEMRQDDQLWNEIALSGVIALHVAGNYSELQMQLWSIAR